MPQVLHFLMEAAKKFTCGHPHELAVPPLILELQADYLREAVFNFTEFVEQEEVQTAMVISSRTGDSIYVMRNFSEHYDDMFHFRFEM